MSTSLIQVFGYFKLNTSDSLTEQITPDATCLGAPGHGPGPLGGDGAEAELGLWLRALRSFFQVRNHPFSAADHAGVLTRDWAPEVRIVRRVLLQSSQLAHRLIGAEGAGETPFIETDGGAGLSDSPLADSQTEASTGAAEGSPVALAGVLREAAMVCESLLEARAVSFHAWASIGKMLARELDRSDAAREVERLEHYHAAANLQAPLIALTREAATPGALGADMLVIFSELAQLLKRLHFVETFLGRDYPLKQVLPIFTFVHGEARSLLEFIEKRALRTVGLAEPVFGALDGTSYAITMELRKVFAHELVGVSALRQAPTIYAKVENAHSLLRDCFQQSTVGLAQLFDPGLDGARLFNTFQIRLEQSLVLRHDLWTLLQLVRRAEEERDLYPIGRLLERLASFRCESLRYLMYKDWEACERFIEEVSTARGAAELTPVLHRFSAYLEALHGQVNMRAVLAAHPFDYPPTER